MIDATHAIELDREENAEKKHAAAVRDEALRMEWALDALNDAIINIAARYRVNTDSLGLAYKMDGSVYILAPPTSIAGRLEWLGRQIGDAADLVAMDLSDPLAPQRPETAKRLRRLLQASERSVHLARIDWREQLAAEKDLSALATLFPQVGDTEAEK